MHRSLLLTFAIVVAACTADPTAPTARIPAKPSLDFDAARPAPVLVSAVIVETDPSYGLPLVRLTFLDTAEDEAKAIAYFTMADGSHSTQNASGIAGTGERVIDFYALPGVVSAQLYFMWKDANAVAICGCVFSSLSNVVDVVDGTLSATAKRKGKK